MIRVLHVIGTMGSGGAETLIMNVYRHIDKTQIQFDFVVHTKDECFYDKEIIKLGGRIYHTERFNVINWLSYKKFWNNFFSEHKEHKIVHGHINSSAAIYLSVAKRYGKIAVVHSHSVKRTEKSLRSYMFRIFVYPIRYIADYFLACSEEAGETRFGKHVTESENYKVFKNGIDVKQFCFQKEVRKVIREKYGIAEEKLIIGHVGRFTYAKNHKFLLKVYKEVSKMYSNVELWLIGTGGLEGKIRTQVQNMGIEKEVRFIGETSHVSEYLQAMDIFVFPSFYEGLPLALVEAQAAGLPCLISDVISDEADMKCGLVKRLSLENSTEDWAEAIVAQKGVSRIDTSNYLQKSGFDIEAVSKELQDFYADIRRT